MSDTPVDHADRGRRPRRGVRAAADGPTVVVAEDDPDLRSLYEVWLAERSASVAAVGDGGRALEATSTTTSLVVCDRDMPGRCGAEVVAALAGHDAAVVVISGDPPDETLPAAVVDAYLQKPVTRDEFGAVLDRFL
jgi:CheY-like chemotaxis protein